MPFRIFCYADIHGIDSLHSQLHDCADRTIITRFKSVTQKMSANIGFTNIIRGAAHANAGIEFGKDSAYSEAREVFESTGRKINKILSILDYDENIPLSACNLSALQTQSLLVKFKSNIVRIRNYQLPCDDFIYTEVKALWQKAKVFGGPSGIDHCEFISNAALSSSTKAISVFVGDLELPVIMDLSFSKMLVPLSSFRTAPLFVVGKDLHILGCINDTGYGVYHIKPFAIWSVMTETQLREKNLSSKGIIKSKNLYFGG